MIYRAQILLIVFTLLSSSQLLSQEVEGITIPGGFALIPLFSLDRPSIRFGLKPIAMLDELAEEGVWIGLVGIDLITTPGHYFVTKNSFYNDAHDDLIDITVHPIKRDLQPNKTINTPIKEYLRKLLAKKTTDNTAKELAGDWQQSRFFSLPFLIPLEQGVIGQEMFGTYISSPSGELHLINSLFVKSNDITKPITAPSGGKIHRIKKSQERLANANVSIVIDHGQGIFSILRGQILPDVAVGDVVKKGAALAFFNTEEKSRTEGVWELSWQLVVNGDLVDPSHFLKLDLNTYLPKWSSDAEGYYFASRAADQISMVQKESDPLEDATFSPADGLDSTTVAPPVQSTTIPTTNRVGPPSTANTQTEEFN